MPNKCLTNVTIVIRSCGERTVEVCKNLILEQGVPVDSVFTLNESPFSKALHLGSQIGIDEGKDWTLFVDADVLIRPGSIPRLLKHAESLPKEVCEVQGYCLDKFFGGARQVGIRLYRTSLLNVFILNIPGEGTDIRPESRALESMAAQGYSRRVVPEITGLHGFEQCYEDIFRTSFVQAHKHLQFSQFFVSYWRSMIGFDEDYKVALEGFGAGVSHLGDVRIDKGASYFQKTLDNLSTYPKPKLEKSSWTLSKVEETIINWKEPDTYFDFFFSGIVGSKSNLFERISSSLRPQIMRKGLKNGVLAWLGWVFSDLARK